jgi:hypothetical protein
MIQNKVHIINADGHVPPLPLMIVDRFAMQVDLAKIEGELFDPTVAEITWGDKTDGGKLFGRVRLKNGTGRTFWDPELLLPYLKAFRLAKADHDLRVALVEQKRIDDLGRAVSEINSPPAD